MSKKLQLDLKYIPDFEVVGVFAGIQDYRLCWLINKYLNADFCREKDVLLTPFKNKEKASFSMFYYKNENLQLKYYLLSNKSEQYKLLPEPKGIDFLLILKSKEMRIDLNELSGKLRNIPQISTALWFKEPDKVKNLYNILYEFEIELLNISK